MNRCPSTHALTGRQCDRSEGHPDHHLSTGAHDALAWGADYDSAPSLDAGSCPAETAS